MGHGLRDLEIQAQACVQQPRQHPATSELRSVFAGYVCICGTCVLSEWIAHASKSSTYVQLSVGNFGLPEMQQFSWRVMLLNATYDRFMLQN